MPEITPRSQEPNALHGPIFISFGDLNKAVLKVCWQAELTPRETLILNYIVSVMNRPKYRTDIIQGILLPASEIEEFCGMQIDNANKAIKSLVEKGLLKSQKKSKTSPRTLWFSNQLIESIVNGTLWMNVDKKSNLGREQPKSESHLGREQPKHLGREQPKHLGREQPKLFVIEDPSIPSSPSTSSNSPCLETVDNSECATMDDMPKKKKYSLQELVKAMRAKKPQLSETLAIKSILQVLDSGKSSEEIMQIIEDMEKNNHDRL